MIVTALDLLLQLLNVYLGLAQLRRCSKPKRPPPDATQRRTTHRLSLALTLTSTSTTGPATKNKLRR